MEQTSPRSVEENEVVAISPKQFSEEVKTATKIVKELMTLSKNIGKYGYINSKIKKGKEEEIIKVDRENVKEITKELFENMNLWIKYYRACNGKKHHRVSKINPTNILFCISDTLKNFLLKEDYGNGLIFLIVNDPDFNLEKKLEMSHLNGNVENNRKKFNEEIHGIKKYIEQPDFKNLNLTLNNMNINGMIKNLLDNNLITSHILLLLFTFIIYTKQLDVKGHGQRIHYDDLMNEYFGINSGKNTHYIINGEDLSKGIVEKFKLDNIDDASEKFRKEAKGSYKQTTINKIAKGLMKSKENSFEWNLSAFSRIENYKPEKISESAIKKENFIPKYINGDNDNWGFRFAMLLVISSFFRIPEDILPKKYVDQISNEENKQLATNLTGYLEQVSRSYKELNKETHKKKSTK